MNLSERIALRELQLALAKIPAGQRLVMRAPEPRKPRWLQNLAAKELSDRRPA